MSLLISAEKPVTRQRAARPDLLQYANRKRNEGTLNDVSIEVDTETIAANRMILSCCSRFFEGMFDLEMKEKYQDSVQISGFDGKAVKALIDFMYSGEVTIKNENVMDLLAASDYLQMGEVKQFCFDFLESIILSSDNWFAIRSAADLYQNKHLQNQVDKFLSKNFDTIVETDEFKSLDKASLRSCIAKLDRNHTTDSSIFNGLIIWSQADEEVRKTDFPELFRELIQLDKMSVEVLEKTVLKVDLVSKSYQCLNLVTKSVFQRDRRVGLTKILSFGGTNFQGKCTEVYNGGNKPSKKYPNLPKHLDAHCLLPCNNFVYCIGGSIENVEGKSVPQNKVWRLNLDDQVLKWKRVTRLKQKRFAMGGAVFHEALVVAGGWNDIEDMASVEYYQAAVNEWKISTSLRQPRGCCALVASKQYLYAVGGMANNKCLSSVERTENLKEQWQQIQPMQMPRQYLATVNCNGIIYAIGGQFGKKSKTTTNTVEKYEADDDKWSYVSSMIMERSAHAACVMNDKIYVVGGLDASDDVVNIIECYNPITDSWSVVGKTDADLFHHSLIAL